MANYTKQYINMANQQYAERIAADHQKKIAAERAALKRRVEEEERRQKILSALKI
jgi:hypothetical protein